MNNQTLTQVQRKALVTEMTGNTWYAVNETICFGVRGHTVDGVRVEEPAPPYWNPRYNKEQRCTLIEFLFRVHKFPLPQKLGAAILLRETHTMEQYAFNAWKNPKRKSYA